jgi:predicted Zn-dependent peptidase
MLPIHRPLSAFLLACAVASPLAAQTVERWELAGGLPLVVAERHATPLVAVCLMVRAGTVHEGELAGSGAAGLAARLLAPAQELTELGSGWQVQVGAGSAAITVLTTSGNEDEVLRLLLAGVGGARFTNDDISRWRARQPAAEDPGAALIGLLAPTSPARWPVDGLPGARAARQPDGLDLNAWFRAHWRSGNAVLAVAGNVHAPAVRQAAEQAAGALPPGGAVDTIAPVTASDRDRRRSVPTSGQSQVRLAWLAPPPGHADHAALAALVHDLRLRLAGTATVELRHDGDAPAMLVIAAPIDGTSVGAQETRVLAAVRQVGSDPVLAARAIRAAQADLAGVASDAGELARAIAETDLLTADAGAWPRLHAAVGALTPADLDRAATTWLRTAHHATLALVSPADAPAAWDGSPLAGTAAPPVTLRGASGLRVVVRGGLEQGLSAACLRLGGDGEDADTLDLIACTAVRATRFATPEDMAERCAEAGLHLTGRSEAGALEFTVSGLPDRLDQGIDLLLEIAAEAALPPEELAQSRRTRDMERATDPAAVVERALHPGTPVAPVRTSLWPRWRRLAVAGNATLAVQGRVDAAALLARAEARLPVGPAVVAAAPSALPGGLVSCSWPALGDGIALLWDLPEQAPATAAVFDRLLAVRLASLDLTVRRTGRRLLVSGPRRPAGALPPSATPEAITTTVREAASGGADAAVLGRLRAACLTAWADERQDPLRTVMADAAAADPAADARWPDALRAVTAADLARVALALAGEPTVVVLHATEPNR